MSIFDVLKYGGTDLGSQAELETLPEGLIDLYWIQAHAKTPTEDYNPFYKKKCSALAMWGKYTGGLENSYARQAFAKQAFAKALSEYNI